MDVSVIIVNYNTLQMTQDCIDSVFNKTKDVEYEVILVDNASTDGSKEHFEKDDRIRYIYSNENLGFGRANNLGYQFSRGNYIFLLNSDTLLLNNAIMEFKKYLDNSENDVCCVGCELVDKDGKPAGSYGGFPDVKNFLGRILAHYKIHSEFLYGKTKASNHFPFKVDYICGADLFIRRQVIEQCGLFDPDFFLYFEETEMQYRFQKNGYYSMIINSAEIMHLHGGSDMQKGKFRRKSLRVANIEMKSRFMYCNKIYGKKKTRLIALMHILLIPRIMLYNALWKEKKKMVMTIIRNLK